MDLKKLMVDTKAVWVDFPGLAGFEVEVANLSRKELTGLRKKCTTTKFDRKDPKQELEYSSENAETLVSSSTEFDTWLNEVVFDLDNFRSKPKGADVPKAGKVLQE